MYVSGKVGGGGGGGEHIEKTLLQQLFRKIETHERFKRTVFIRTKHNLQFVGMKNDEKSDRKLTVILLLDNCIVNLHPGQVAPFCGGCFSPGKWTRLSHGIYIRSSDRNPFWTHSS